MPVLHQRERQGAHRASGVVVLTDPPRAALRSSLADLEPCADVRATSMTRHTIGLLRR